MNPRERERGQKLMLTRQSKFFFISEQFNNNLCYNNDNVVIDNSDKLKKNKKN